MCKLAWVGARSNERTSALELLSAAIVMSLLLLNSNLNILAQQDFVFER